MEHPIKMDDLGVPPFQETSTYNQTYTIVDSKGLGGGWVTTWLTLGLEGGHLLTLLEFDMCRWCL